MYTWNDIISLLNGHPFGTMLRIEHWKMQHPRDGGLSPTASIAEPANNSFRRYLSEDTVLVVRTDATHYHASLVKVTLPKAMPTHARTAGLSPGELLLASTALGALFGAAVGGKKGALLGSMVGGMAGLAATGLDNADSSPATAQLAKELFTTLGQSVAMPVVHQPALREVVARRPAQLVSPPALRRTKGA